MKYESLDDAGRATMQGMDAAGEQLLLKLRADAQSSPELRAGILHVLKLAKLYTPTAGHKRIGKALADLARELL